MLFDRISLVDAELIDMLKETLPDDLPTVFISSVANMGLDELKDTLWRELNSESNKLQDIISGENLVHRDKDMKNQINLEGLDELDDFEEAEDDDDIEELDDFEYED